VFPDENAGKYWFNVLQIALRNSITRVKRCCQIMGRNESGATPGQFSVTCGDFPFI